MQPVPTETLEEKTLRYWLLTSFPISAKDAISTSNELLSQLNPSRPLAHIVNAYLTRVIVGGRRKKLTKINNVVQMKVDAQ